MRDVSSYVFKSKPCDVPSLYIKLSKWLSHGPDNALISPTLIASSLSKKLVVKSQINLLFLSLAGYADEVVAATRA